MARDHDPEKPRRDRRRRRGGAGRGSKGDVDDDIASVYSLSGGVPFVSPDKLLAETDAGSHVSTDRYQVTYTARYFAALLRALRQKRRSVLTSVVELCLPIVFVLVTVIVWALFSRSTEREANELSYERASSGIIADYYRQMMCANASMDPNHISIPNLAPCEFASYTVTCAGDESTLPVRGLCHSADVNLSTLLGIFLNSIVGVTAMVLPLDTIIIHQWIARKAFASGEIQNAYLTTSSGVINSRLNAILSSGLMSFVPQDNKTQAFMDYLNNTSLYFRFVNGGAFASVDEAMAAAKAKEQSMWCVVELRALDADNFDVVLHMNSSSLPDLHKTIDVQYPGGTQFDRGELYIASGFNAMQRSLYEYYIGHVAATKMPGTTPARVQAELQEVHPYVVGFGYIEYKPNLLLTTAAPIIAFALVLSFLYPTVQLVKSIVLEKELRIHEAMLIMGQRHTALYLTWFSLYAVQHLLECLVITIMLKLTYMRKTDAWCLFISFYVFALTTIPLAGCIAAFFSKARLAGMLTPLIYFAMSMPIFAFTTTSTAVLVGFSVLSPTAFASMLSNIIQLETSEGFMFADLHGNKFTPQTQIYLIMLIVEFVVYYLLTAYLDAVLPKEWGTRRHPLFFVRDPLRRLCGSSAQSRHSAGGGGEDGRYPDGVFEEEEDDDDDDTNDDGDDDGRSRRCSVRMVGLRKQYRRNGKPFLAVNNFYWRLREGEIAVLLGHNGAGKTTLMSMLTGMTSPDAGDCFIYGHSVREELSRARQLIGFCPQHNILWPELTCREHLEYYAAIKGLRGSVLQESVQAMLREVDLLDKIDYPSRALSGGQKRKLSIAIAFVGRSPLVFLDEPTAGMDVAARRFTWELLKRMARSHTILLSTHYMDEADLLGDTVAIMNHGRLQCCGTSLFLKARLGLGYVLHLSLAAHASVSDIADLVRGHVAEAESLQTGLTELAFRLPRHRLPAFAALLAAVESRRRELCIAAFSIAATTLEEVFLQLTERAPPPSSLLSTTTRKTMSTKRGGALEGATWTHKAIAVAAGLWLAAARPVGAVCGCHVRRNSDSDNDIDVSGNNNNNNNNSRSCEATRARADTTATTANATTAVYTTASPHETRVFAQHCHHDDNNNNNNHNNSSSSSNVGDADSTVVPVALNAVTTRDGDGAARSLSRLPVSSAASSDSNAGTMMTTTTTTTTTTLAMTPLASAPDSKPVSNVWNVPRLRRRRSVLWSQLKAVLRKRLRNGLRDRRTQFFQVICPVVCVMLAMLLMLIKFFPRQPIALTSDLYGTDVEVDVANCDGVVAPTRPFAARAHTVVVSPEASSASRSDATALSTATLAMSQHMMRTIDTHDLGYERYGGIVCLDPMLVSLAGMLASLTYNTTALHESAIAMYNLYDAYYYTELRRRRTTTTTTTTSSAAGDAADSDGDAQRHLHTVIDPMPMTSSERNVNAAIYTMIIGVIIMIPFTFIPSTFVAWIVKERECKARHLQSISGLSYAIYWLSNYVYDVASYIVTMMLVLVVFAIFQRKEYIGADTIGPTIVLLFLYGVSGVSMAYTLSFLFREHSSAQNALLLGNFITGFLLVMCTTMLSLLDNTVKVANVLRWIFRLVPSYCVGEGIINISKNTLTNNGLLRPVSAWSMAVVGWPCAYMAMELPVFVLLTLFIDYPGRRQRAQRLFHDPDAPPEEMVDEDSDVVQEREAVKHAAERAGDHVRVVHLRKKFGNGTVAVRNLTVGVKPGEVFGFLGTNGAGKTTTMSILCQEFLPTSGYAYVCGYDIVTHSSEALRCIGYCPQFDATLDLLTVHDHLELYAGIRGIAYSERERVVDGIIQLCELSNYRNVLAHQLSGGNRRKLSVAIALVGGPPVVFLDEPSAGMDPVARRGLWNTIQTVSKDCSIVLTTHHLEEVEVLAHRVAIMVDGTLRCIGDKTHLKHKYGSGFEVSMRLATHAQSFDDVDAFFATRFPGSILRERHAQRVIYELPSDVRLSEVFRQLDAHATALRVADYSISQTSIEQVFLRISEEAERRRCQAEAEADANDEDGHRRKRCCPCCCF